MNNSKVICNILGKGRKKRKKKNRRGLKRIYAEKRALMLERQDYKTKYDPRFLKNFAASIVDPKC